MKANLKKVLIGLTVAWLIFGVAYALTTLVYKMPMKAKIPISVETYVEGQAWTNNTAVDWGNVTPGQTYTKTLDIHNTGTATITVTFLVSNLPSGWSLT